MYGSTARARERGSRPGYPWRVEAADPDNEVDKSPKVEARNFLVLVNLENARRSRLRNPSPFRRKIPDVLIDAPVVKLEGLDFELNDLRAKVALFAKVLDLVELTVGIDAYLGRVKLTIDSIEVQALLKVRLDNVRA